MTYASWVRTRGPATGTSGATRSTGHDLVSCLPLVRRGEGIFARSRTPPVPPGLGRSRLVTSTLRTSSAWLTCNGGLFHQPGNLIENDAQLRFLAGSRTD